MYVCSLRYISWDYFQHFPRIYISHPSFVVQEPEQWPSCLEQVSVVFWHCPRFTIRPCFLRQDCLWGKLFSSPHLVPCKPSRIMTLITLNSYRYASLSFEQIEFLFRSCWWMLQTTSFPLLLFLVYVAYYSGILFPFQDIHMTRPTIFCGAAIVIIV